MPRLDSLTFYVLLRTAHMPTFGLEHVVATLFTADMEAYRTLGRPITGAEYIRGPLQPVVRGGYLTAEHLIRSAQGFAGVPQTGTRYQSDMAALNAMMIAHGMEPRPIPMRDPSMFPQG